MGNICKFQDFDNMIMIGVSDPVFKNVLINERSH